MLDKKTDALLRRLNQLAPCGYTVLSTEEIVEGASELANLSDKTLSSALTYLKQNDYVDVKYRDKDEICLCMTLKAESYLEGEKELPAKTKLAGTQLGLLLTLVFGAAFVGAFLAGLLLKML